MDNAGMWKITVSLYKNFKGILFCFILSIFSYRGLHYDGH
ncbi:hypothetical protein PFDG_05100 [Plasmodium falciparum Dd2]|uniref:Uncharacterized protein n=1 Tax=Plasmodium falciparum (isolate Dd2) TaxID=57267 RepID=A0A0L7M9Q1_PLAF4|nr:hypothetical protein PFDG_05100 [Plasmodium falciparum Dd2]